MTRPNVLILHATGTNRDVETTNAVKLAGGVPTILLTWTDASEDNWPDAIADEINPNFLAATGRMTTLAVMSVAR